MFSGVEKRHIGNEWVKLFWRKLETYLGPCQTFMMEIFAKIVKGLKTLNIFSKKLCLPGSQISHWKWTDFKYLTCNCLSTFQIMMFPEKSPTKTGTEICQFYIVLYKWYNAKNKKECRVLSVWCMYIYGLKKGP